MPAQTPQPITNRRDLIGPGLRTFFNIAEKWQLTTDEARILLGQPSRSSYFRWKSGDVGNVPHDLAERLSYILGIYKALQILLPTADHADTWIRRPNHAPQFNGQSPLERLLVGRVADLYVVRQYLDAERGW